MSQDLPNQQLDLADRYHEHRIESRRYRDYQFGVVGWHTSVILYLTGVVLGKDAPRLNELQAWVLGAVFLVLTGIACRLIWHCHQRYSFLRDKLLPLEGDFVPKTNRFAPHWLLIIACCLLFLLFVITLCNRVLG